MRAARAQFAAEFLACGGFQTTKKQFESAEQIARADADLFVLCSSDADYDAITSKLMPMLRERKHRAKVVIAGNPEGAQRLSELGITAFIHMRSNAVEVLSAIQQQLGIEE